MKKILLLKFVVCISMLTSLVASVQDAKAQVYYTESFDTTVFPPPGWTAVGPLNRWSRQATGTNPTCTPHSGAAMARYSRNGGPNVSQIFSSPAIDYSNRGVDTPRVSFWIYRDDGADTVLDIITLFVNTTQSTTGATTLGTVARSRTQPYPDTVATNGWYQYTYDIPQGYSSATNYILVRGFSGASAGNNIFIDDIQYDAFPTPCSGSPTPGSITANDTVICGGTGSTMLSLVGYGTENGISFQWKSGASATGPWTNFGTSVTSISTGTISTTTYYYAVATCSNSGLSDSTAVIQITVDPNPAPVLSITTSNNGNVCAGIPDTLIATGAIYYVWSPNTGLNTDTGSTVLALPTGNPGSMAVFTVTGTNAAGCAGRDSVVLALHSTPTIVIQTTPNDTLCTGQQADMTANCVGCFAPVTLLWSTGETTQTISLTPSADSVVSVYAVNQFGCYDRDTVSLHITTGTPPQITSVTANHNGVYCVGSDSVTLSAAGTGATAFTWSPANGLSSTTGSIIKAAPQGGGPGGGSILYTVTLTNAGGCAASDTIRVRRSNPPGLQIQATPPGDSICAGQAVSLTANVVLPNDTFLWTPSGDTSRTIIVAPTSQTTYIVRAISAASGCANYDTLTLYVLPALTASFGYNVTGLEVTFNNTSTTGLTYNWNFGDTSFSSQANPPPHIYNYSGFDTVRLVVSNGNCSDTVFHIIHVQPIGINEITENEGIYLWPNPTHDGITTLQFVSGKSDAELRVMNAMGQVVQQKTIASKGSKMYKEQIDLSTFTPGVYTIHLDIEGKSLNRVIIKE